MNQRKSQNYLKALLSLLLSVGLLCACSAPRPPVPKAEEFDPSQPLTICFDLDNPGADLRHYEYDGTGMTYTGASQRQAAVDLFLQDLKEAGGPQNVEVEFLEGRGSDRDGQLTHLRAELMAGAGPDLFVLRQCGLSGDLFLFPEKKMEDGLFLPLDSYMETARFMEPDKMFSPIFDAGLTSDGRRMLLPMTYSINAALIPAEGLDLEASHSFSDMLEGDLGGAFALWREEVPGPFFQWYPALGQLADYKKETLAFSQEELGELFEKMLSYNRRLDAGEADAPAGLCLGDLPSLDTVLKEQGWSQEPVALAPIYNREGGVTARINFFSGVNANSKNPAGAFWAADFLLGRDYMRDSDLYMYMWWDTLPIYEGLLGPDEPLPYTRLGRGTGKSQEFSHSITGEGWTAFQSLTASITDAEFTTELDMVLARGYGDYYRAEDDAQRKKALSDVYTNLKMLLGES